jgi:hypothetical protein
VAALRRCVKKIGSHATTQRRNEQIKNFIRIIKTSRSSVAALREKIGPHATTQRRNEQIKKFS